MNKRIEFVDLAKGLCLLLIVLTHTFGDSGGAPLEILSVFKVPVFFVLSGFFFRRYDSEAMFLKKKTNQLLIPMVFAFVFLSLPWTFISSYKDDFSIPLRDFFFLPETWKINFGLSPSTWFLVCLFWTNIMLWTVKRKDGFQIIHYMVVVGLGVFGYVLSIIDMSLPVWFDTALVVFPFFVFGNVTWNCFSFWQKPVSAMHYWIFVASLVVFVLTLFVIGGHSNTFYAANRYQNVSIICLYIGGISGSIFVILLTKLLNKVPVISYIGRYSIVVLVMHQFYLFVIRNVLYRLQVPQDDVWVNIGVFLFVVMISLPTIKYGVKYLPYCFAQKSLWK